MIIIIKDACSVEMILLLDVIEHNLERIITLAELGERLQLRPTGQLLEHLADHLSRVQEQVEAVEYLLLAVFPIRYQVHDQFHIEHVQLLPVRVHLHLLFNITLAAVSVMAKVQAHFLRQAYSFAVL